MNKLDLPKGWGEDKITAFFDTARENCYATFHNDSSYFKRLIEINKIFLSAIDYMENSKSWFALFFFLKAHSAFLGATYLTSSTQIPEAFMVLRSVLENSLYGLFIDKNPKLAKIWLERHKDEMSKKAVRNKFKILFMLKLLRNCDSKLAKATEILYERCIDYGAHPNERSLSSFLKKETKDEGVIQFNLQYMTDNRTSIKFCLKSAAQVGICSLKILELVIPERFKITGLSEKLNIVSGGL